MNGYIKLICRKSDKSIHREKMNFLLNTFSVNPDCISESVYYKDERFIVLEAEFSLDEYEKDIISSAIGKLFGKVNVTDESDSAEFNVYTNTEDIASGEVFFYMYIKKKK
ncbi:MAG: hypothetical protein IKM61_06050 [Eubacteriaceae bacterium]|nr:hypothetical protein [Eubacteriaceae bacterium]